MDIEELLTMNFRIKVTKFINYVDLIFKSLGLYYNQATVREQDLINTLGKPERYYNEMKGMLLSLATKFDIEIKINYIMKRKK